MSGIDSVLEKLRGTEEYEILSEMDSFYKRIAEEENLWLEKSKLTCPSGCGKCCEHFEPDLFEGEALYMAAWIFENKPEWIEKILQKKFPFPAENRCPFFNPDSPFHCSIYLGRAFICRLFGASGTRDKKENEVWRPCKFYPQEILAAHQPPLSHRTYSKAEIAAIFHALPPAMGDLMEQSLSITPDDESTEMLRDALPKALNKLLFILNLSQ